MTVNKYATQAGKRYETELLKHLRGLGYDVERLRLTGAEDEGDLLLRVNLNVLDRVVIEAKRTRSLNLSGWVGEAETEHKNYMKHRQLPSSTGFIVIHNARNKSIGKSYVTTTLDEYLRQIS